jgi:hypothetical protein
MAMTMPLLTQSGRKTARPSGAAATHRDTRLGAEPAPFRLKTAQDVIDLLQEQIAAVRADVEADPLEKAQAIGLAVLR